MPTYKRIRDEEITLADSLQVISTIQKLCNEAGYYIALAGGTLNHCVSYNDIDLVAVPMAGESKQEDLEAVLGVVAKWDLRWTPTRNKSGSGMDIYHYKTPQCIPVDVAVVGSKV